MNRDKANWGPFRKPCRLSFCHYAERSAPQPGDSPKARLDGERGGGSGEKRNDWKTKSLSLEKGKDTAKYLGGGTQAHAYFESGKRASKKIKCRAESRRRGFKGGKTASWQKKGGGRGGLTITTRWKNSASKTKGK